MNSTYIVLLRTFFDICIFRKRPQDIPFANELFVVTMFMYLVVSAAISYPAHPSFAAFISGIVDTVMLVSVTYLFVYLRSVPKRWLQTTTALAGTGFIFNLLALPLFYLRVYVSQEPTSQSSIETLILLLVFWNLAVTSHIFRHAFSSSYLLGLLASLTYIALVTFALQVIIPVPEVM